MIKRIRTVTSLVVTMGLLGSTSSWAFNSQKIQAIVATANTVGTNTADFALSIRDVINTGVTRPNITWTNVNPGAIPSDQHGYVIADSMMQLQWNVTDPNGGIQIYTDNANAAASPHFVDPTPLTTSNPDSDPAGLVLVPGAGSDSSVTIPLAWSIKSSTAVVNPAGGSMIQSFATDPNDVSISTTGAGSRYQWLSLLDKTTPNIDRNGNGFNMGEENPDTKLPYDTAAPFTFGTSQPTTDYVKMAKNTGIQAAAGSFFPDGDKISYVYLEAGFATAAANSTYRTSRLTVEAFIQ